MNSSNSSSTSGTYDYQKRELNLYYAVCEVLVAFFAVVGNALVIFVFRKERKLRRRTNYYIVSLATADFLVGLLGIPFAIMSSVGLPTNLQACLFTASLLVVLCTISIFCLVAVSVDRYWAILHPMGYSRNVRTKTALVIIGICWIAGCIVGFLPLMGWHKDAPSDGRCFFLDVMDYNYLVFLYFGTIITPALLLAAFYAHIYQVVLKQLRQIVTMNPENGSSSRGYSTGGTMLRMLGAAQKREVKATQNLAIIVLFFMICWIPLYTVNCILAFCRNCNIDSTFMLSCIILSHLNSAGNPLLYAYHLKDFRAALKNFFCNLFGYSEEINAPSTRRASNLSNKNYNHYRPQSIREARNNSNSNSNYGKDYGSKLYVQLKASKVSTLVHNSTTLAIAATGELNREIFNIPEISSDSDIESSHNDKISIVKSITPYRIRRNSQHNRAYSDTCNENTLSDTVRESERINVPTITSAAKTGSSPQLSKNLFLIETEFSKSCSKLIRSYSCAEGNKSSLNLSPMKSVGKMFKNNGNMLNRSLSDEGQGMVSRQANATIVKSSCAR